MSERSEKEIQDDVRNVQQQLQTDMEMRANLVASMFKAILGKEGEKAAVEYASKLLASTPPEKLTEAMSYLPTDVREAILRNPQDVPTDHLSALEICVENLRSGVGGKEGADALTQAFDIMEKHKDTAYAKQRIVEEYSSLPEDVRTTLIEHLPDRITGAILLSAFTDAIKTQAKRPKTPR